MELRHLKYFKVVAEELHFGRAAERLHIDPSSVSKSIKELEEKLDSKLLLRDSRKVSLTKEGHLFLEETNTIFSILKRAKHKVCSANSRAKYFKIAISSTINIHFYKLSELLRFFRQEKPEVDIQVYEVDHENLLKGLEVALPNAEPKVAKSQKHKKTRAKKTVISDGIVTESPIESIEPPEKLLFVPEHVEKTKSVSTGEHFIGWLKEAILTQKLMINEPQALIHTVSDTLYIVTPGIFMRYASEHSELQSSAKEEKLPVWRFVQKSFEKMKAHKKQPAGLNIWTCTVKGPHSTKKVHGYLFAKPQDILPDIMFNNPYMTLDET